MEAMPFYKDYHSIYTMNTIGDGLSSRYPSSSSNKISHSITNSEVVDAIDNQSVPRDINLESSQAVTFETAKTQVYLRQIMEHLSLPANVS